MIIDETPLHGRFQLETSAWTTPFTWIDQTSNLVEEIDYSEGGRLNTAGDSGVDVGTLVATLKDTATTPLVGDLVRLRRYGTTEYWFTGYVQDVSQKIVFDKTISINTPATYTTISCLDWVGYLGQLQAVGAGGADPTTGTNNSLSNYEWNYRPAALNKILDPSYATKIISIVTDGTFVLGLGDTDLVGTFSEHLDLVTRTVDTYWFGKHVIPTDKTTGRTGLVEIRSGTSLVSSGKTFTDQVGSAGELHYTEIDLENSSLNIANSVIVNNRVRVEVGRGEITQVGGYNQSNFVVVNDEHVAGVGLNSVHKALDTTSVTTYGNRQTQIDSNAALQVRDENLVTNTSIEYSDSGFLVQTNSKNRRKRPADAATPFTAYDGEWAMRLRTTSGGSQQRFTFDGGADTVPVLPGAFYRFHARVARGVPSRTDARSFAQIDWIGEDDTIISSSTGSNVSLTTQNTWYLVQTSGTAPSGAVRVELRIETRRSGGGNHSIGDHYWVDALHLNTDPGSTTDFFDGDTPWTDDYGYLWTGGVGASASLRVYNRLDLVANEFLAKYSTTSMRVSRIRWNAQEDLSAVSSLTVGKTVVLKYDGTTATYRIVGIDGSIQYSRYVIDYYLVKT
jgi:hypothetical protein